MNIKRPEPDQQIPSHAKKTFEGKLFDVYQWEQELYNGTKATFEKVKRSDTVIVFPVLPSGKILLAKQEQPGKARFISAFGGRIDKEEDVLEAAKRELLEETGYEASEFILWDARQPASKVDWAVYTFVAKGLKKVTSPDLDGGEKIELMETTFDELFNIAIQDNFSEKEILGKLLAAKLNPEKMKILLELFKPL